MTTVTDRILNVLFPLRKRAMEASMQAEEASQDALYRLRELRHEMQLRRAMEIDEAAERRRGMQARELSGD